ncbi:MAG: proton-conducting transporter membrane subunit [Myxococcota bacterium]
MTTVFLPALGALVVLFFDALAGQPPRGRAAPRHSALSGIRLGVIAVLSLASVLVALSAGLGPTSSGPFTIDAFAAVGITLILLTSFLVLLLSLTHFGMARSRAGEPIALLLFSLSGMLAAVASTNLLALLLCLELAWLPVVALVAIDARRLSSSESSLKLLFAHALASLTLTLGIAFLFFSTGRFDLALLEAGSLDRPLFFELGTALVVVGLLARCAVAPFHPWAPDLYEGAPAFVTAHMATASQIACFFVVLRVVHAIPGAAAEGAGDVAQRLPGWLGFVACLTLVWGHAMALVQVRLRRLVGWLAVGQAGFAALALIDARAAGGAAMVWALVAAGVASIGLLTTISSFSHHERACEHVGDLAGMASESPARATLLAIFLLSLAGFPGTIGFTARRDVLMAALHAGSRIELLVGVVATVLALTAVGRPLVAMLRPAEGRRAASAALTNEQVVLAFCGVVVVLLGVVPLFGEHALSGWVESAVASGVASLRR